jgi:3',5'-cyclic AMP phosphodiesterase CpdA
LPDFIAKVIRSTMFRLAHISDLHLSPIPKVRLKELFSKRITGYVNWNRHRKAFHQIGVLDTLMSEISSKDINHLAITGDMVNLATNPEIIAARKWLEQCCPIETTSLVPGNHDAYVPGAFKQAMQAWKPWVTGDMGEKADVFPYMQRRGPVAIIGLSTSNASMPFRATGNFSTKQADAATKLLIKAKEQNLFRIILIHHPPYEGATHRMKRMYGTKNFRHMLDRASAELILHGHTHLNTRFDINSDQGKVPSIGISSATQIHGDKKPVAGFNLFDISKQGDVWQCEHGRYLLDKSMQHAECVEQTKLY